MIQWSSSQAPLPLPFFPDLFRETLREGFISCVFDAECLTGCPLRVPKDAKGCRYESQGSKQGLCIELAI